MRRVNRLLPLPWACVLVTGPEERPVLCSHHLTMRAATRARERATREHYRASSGGGSRPDPAAIDAPCSST